MEAVTVSKDRLRETLLANKVTHEADFEIAWDAFKEKVTHNFEERVRVLKSLKRGQKVDLYVNFSVPENHAGDYDRAIAMLDWELGDEVELKWHEFEQLVLDNWDWKGQFSASNMLYTGSASPSSSNSRKRSKK